MYDVAVIGAGPAGSRVAGRLAGLGYQVIVLERQPALGAAVCCTGIVGQECVSAFSVSDDVILRRANSARLFAPSGGSLRLWRGEPQACILDRGAFDAAMAARAQESGAQYVMGCPVSDVAVEADGVKVTSSRGESYRARAAVIASGFGPGLADRLGLGRVGDFAAGAQAEVEMVGVEEVEVYFGGEVAPGFFAWLVPASAGRVRVGLLARRKPRYYLQKLLDALKARGRLDSTGVEVRLGGVPLKPLERTFAERLLVVGDAAGQVKPTSGGGIYYGLLCADLAAETLHRALRAGDLSAGRLAGYQRAWRRRLGRELRVGRWARQLYERLSDRQIDQLFDIAREGGIAEELTRAEDVSFDWHSRAIMRLMGQRLISGAVNVVKMPFRQKLT